jgi:hypothetical protein
LPEDRVLLTTVRVEQEPSSPGVWIARAMAFLLLLGTGVNLGRRGR